MAVKKKQAKVRKQVIRTPIDAAPLDKGFEAFKAYVHWGCDKKDYAPIVKGYLKRTLSKEDNKRALTAPEYMFGGYSHVAAAIYWKDVLGFEMPENYPFERVIDTWMENLWQRTSSEIVSVDEKAVIRPVVKTIQQRMQEKVSLTILTDLDRVEDEWAEGKHTGYEMYNKMKEYDLKPGHVAFIRGYVERMRADYLDDEVEEYYPHLKKCEIKRRSEVIGGWIEDLNMFVSSAKAVKKPKVSKPRSAEKMVEKIKYKKQDDIYKIASVPPVMLIGAKCVFLFNTKTRHLRVLESDEGFTVSGSTIKNFNEEKSWQTILRKPEDVLKKLIGKSKVEANRTIKELTTKKTKANGRMNEETIILKTS